MGKKLAHSIVYGNEFMYMPEGYKNPIRLKAVSYPHWGIEPGEVYIRVKKIPKNEKDAAATGVVEFTIHMNYQKELEIVGEE